MSSLTNVRTLHFRPRCHSSVPRFRLLWHGMRASWSTREAMMSWRFSPSRLQFRAPLQFNKHSLQRFSPSCRRTGSAQHRAYQSVSSSHIIWIRCLMCSSWFARPNLLPKKNGLRLLLQSANAVAASWLSQAHGAAR